MSDWGDLVARVRGLSTRLLGAGQLRAIAGSGGLAQLSAAIAQAGVIPAPLERAGVRLLEQGIRRHASRQLHLVWRWAGDRTSRLAPLVEDEDRRSIRAMLRGAASGTPPEARLAGLVATPSLPERALLELARRGDVASVASQLAAMGSPYASAILEEASRQYPDLLRLECALNTRFAARAAAAAARADAPMRAHVSSVLDVENCWTARLLPVNGSPADVADYFVEGGAELSRDRWLAAATAPTVVAREAILQQTAASPWLRAAAAGTARVEDAVLQATIAHQHGLARQDPLGTAPIIEYVLRLRAEVRALQRMAWSVSLRVPAAAIAQALEPVP